MKFRPPSALKPLAEAVGDDALQGTLAVLSLKLPVLAPLALLPISTLRNLILITRKRLRANSPAVILETEFENWRDFYQDSLPTCLTIYGSSPKCVT